MTDEAEEIETTDSLPLLTILAEYSLRQMGVFMSLLKRNVVLLELNNTISHAIQVLSIQLKEEALQIEGISL